MADQVAKLLTTTPEDASTRIDELDDADRAAVAEALEKLCAASARLLIRALFKQRNKDR